MTRDRAPVFLALADLLACLLAYVLVMVNPVHAKTDGLKPKAEFLVTLDYDVNTDADLDLWLVGPDRKPVFYGSRVQGCADLDRDSLGFSTASVTLADGSSIRQKSNRETISLRCIAPGHYDIAVNEFSDHRGADQSPIPAHVEVTGLNPQVSTLLAADTALTHRGHTINVLSFDLAADGKLTAAQPPLESVLDAYEKQKSGSAP